MLGLAWQTLKARKSGFVGAFLAVLCGTALVAACGVLIESGIRSGVPTQRYAAAAVVVAGKQTVRPEGADALSGQHVAEQPTVPADLVGRVAAVPGVRSAVAEVDFPANVVTPDGLLLTGPGGAPSRGHNWDASALAPFTLTEGARPTGADQVVLDGELARRAGVSIGDKVRVDTPTGAGDYLVIGLASAPDLSRQSALYFSPARADALFARPGRVHAVGVLADPGVDEAVLAERIEHAVADQGLSVTTGPDRGMIEFVDVGQSRAILMAIAGSFSGVALLVMIFVVSGTLSLSVAQRRREFALLRAIAATPRQIRALVGGETMLVASVAAVLGGVAGLAVAGGLRDAFATIGVIPQDFQLAMSPLPVVGALLLGVGAARLAAWAAARGPARISPVEALGEAAVEKPGLGRTRTALGVLFLGLGVGSSTLPLFLSGALAAGLSGVSALLIVIGLGLLGPLVVGVILRRIAGPLGRISRVGGYLAAANGVANTRRLAAAVTPLMLAVGFAITNFFSQSIMSAAVQDQTRTSTTADYVVTSTAGGLSPQVADEIRRVPGVAAAVPLVRTHVVTATSTGETVEVRTESALGVDGARVRDTLDLGEVTGDLSGLTGNTVALSEGESSWLGKGIGDEVDLHLGDGSTARLRVAATFTHDLAFGDFLLPADLARAHATDQVDSSVLVRLAPGMDGTAGPALRELADRFPGVVVGDRSAMAAADNTVQRQQFWVNLVAIGVILGYVVIAVANTLAMTTAQRAREFALLRLVGATRRQVRRMTRVEAMVLSGIAVVVGSLIPVPPLVMLGIGLAGDPVPSGPIAVYLGIVAGAAALGLLAVAVPTRLSLRARPIEAIGVRD
ncbi:FtsX-like permease family protein [Actinokineospora enzanensis]|uniref:FtsX-like permease family protein n=1 Tax=Actinokineospora enzanensis TaxID=155975 RepID=UPI000373B286|nr:FtsX-like permease family protein [Actinokineospora enzanensis]